MKTIARFTAINEDYKNLSINEKINLKAFLKYGYDTFL
jgi:hypothetical protein